MIRVTLTSAEVAAEVLEARRTYTGFSTRDVVLSRVGTRAASGVKHGTIFINTWLSRGLYTAFKQCKCTARELGFKFVWHRRGQFLIKWDEGARAHAVASETEVINLYNSLYSSRVAPGAPAPGLSCSAASAAPPSNKSNKSELHESELSSRRLGGPNVRRDPLVQSNNS